MGEVKTAFVTGGTGYIGSYLIRELLREGYHIHALARNPGDLDSFRHPRLTVFKGDLVNPSDIADAMKGCNRVFHLAAKASVWSPDPASFYDVNVRATMNVLECASSMDIDRVVVTGTAGIYGPSLRGVINEDKVRDLDFLNEYEGSKMFAESRVKDFVIRKGLDVVMVSPTRVYGPYLLGEVSSFTYLIDRFVNGKWRFYPGKKSAVGNYIYIDDVVRGHILAMERGEKGETYILGGSNHSNKELLEKLSEISGEQRMLLSVPYWLQMSFARWSIMRAKLFGSVPIVAPKWVRKGKLDYVVDPSKAIEQLGLEITPIDKGLQKTIEWARDKEEYFAIPKEKATLQGSLEHTGRRSSGA